MRITRLAVLCLVALALTGTVQARSAGSPAAPDGLKAFLLRADEVAKHEFSRTPSFAWLPVHGAIRYEFELSKNRSFTEGGIFWSDEKLKVPAGKVRTLDEVYGWDQTASQGLLVDVEHPVLGSLTLPGPPLRFFEADGTEVTRKDHLAPPTLDQHGASVRAWLQDDPDTDGDR